MRTCVFSLTLTCLILGQACNKVEQLPAMLTGLQVEQQSEYLIVTWNESNEVDTYVLYWNFHKHPLCKDDFRISSASTPYTFIQPEEKHVYYQIGIAGENSAGEGLMIHTSISVTN